MVETRGVWGIDIGQAALKAIRLQYVEETEQIVATAFDYVPHPKILSQPDAIPEELIPQALETFLSRNEVEGDLIGISVPGQSALTRFIQLPPVESGKVAEIVKYEARQQIPFALEDVIWDYQPLGSGQEESGFLLDAEVGLFAMKRDQVMQHLQPFTDQKLEVELVQLAPLAIYNYLTYDRLGITPDDEAIGMDEYTILLDMGADNTTLLVSNGEKIWIRNVPVGGNHFTRALTKEMKLTFAKAEYLKCNATKSPDPRAVFQALRPVFNNYVSEIQRSIGFFAGVNREAKISKVVGLGNGFRLAGLQKFLQQNLQYDVECIDTFRSVSGDSVLNAPLFRENVLTFAVSYGVALQTMKYSPIRTSLLPPEMLVARTIRRKKPWAVTTAAALLFGMATTAAAYSNVYRSVSNDRFDDAQAAVAQAQKEADGKKAGYAAEVTKNKNILTNSQKLVLNLKTREDWLEVYRAINECLPRDVGEQIEEKDLALKNRIRINSIKCEKKDVSEWFAGLKDPDKNYMRMEDKKKGPPKGPGYVFTLDCTHYHHNLDPLNDKNETSVLYVQDTLLKNLQQWTFVHPGGTPVPVRKLGISHPTILANYNDKGKVTLTPEGVVSQGAKAGGGGGSRRGDDDAPKRSVLNLKPGQTEAEKDEQTLNEVTFQIQFVWQRIDKAARLEEDPNAKKEDKKSKEDTTKQPASAAEEQQAQKTEEK